MATPRRRARIQKKITRAQGNGNYGRADNLTNRLGNIATREGNRAIGNTPIKKAITGFSNTFKNAAGLPAKNLTANASGFKSTATLNPTTGRVTIPGSSISSPQTAQQKAKIAIFDKKSNRGGGSPSTTRANLQNSGALQPNVGFAGNSIVTGSSFDPNDTSTISYTPTSLNPKVVSVGTDTSFGNPTPVNGSPDAVDTTAVEKGVTTSSAPTGGTVSTARTGTTTAPTGSTATAGATTTGSGITLAPAGSEGYLGWYDYSLSNEERAQQEAYKEEQAYYEKQKNDRVDRNQIMRDALRQFQGEIDATNSVYADKLKQSQLAGLDRLGQSRAENFNAGAVNSSFGNAALERVGAYNRDAEGAVNNEKLQLISSIESAARAAGDKYYQEKKAAKEAGFEAYMASLTNAKSAKETISNNIANNILSSGFDVSQIEPSKLESIAKSAGVSVQSIKSAFDEAKKLAEAEQAQAEQEAAKAERESQFNLSKGQARYDSQGNLLASNYGTDSSNDGLSSEAISLAEQINSGLITLDKVPSAMRGEVSLALNTLPDPRVAELDTVLETIDELAANPKLDNILGPIDQRTGGLFGKAATAKNLYEQLTGILALEGRNKLKGSGAISDFEFKVLKEAQSALGRNLNTTEFKVQLEKVRNVLEKRKAFLESSRGGAKPVKTIDDYRSEFPQATDEELQALYEEEQLSFNQVGGGTYNAQSIANAIKQVESQGNYNARGGSGETGAYQFMPATWKQWAGEFLGNPNAPQTQENQDYVAVAKIDSLIKQGYTPQEIALIWNGGTPTVKRGTNKYGVAYDSGAYANKVLNALG